jgi:hypothetical protein
MSFGAVIKGERLYEEAPPPIFTLRRGVCQECGRESFCGGGIEAPDRDLCGVCRVALAQQSGSFCKPAGHITFREKENHA